MIDLYVGKCQVNKGDVFEIAIEYELEEVLEEIYKDIDHLTQRENKTHEYWVDHYTINDLALEHIFVSPEILYKYLIDKGII